MCGALFTAVTTTMLTALCNIRNSLFFYTFFIIKEMCVFPLDKSVLIHVLFDTTTRLVLVGDI